MAIVAAGIPAMILLVDWTTTAIGLSDGLPMWSYVFAVFLVLLPLRFLAAVTILAGGRLVLGRPRCRRGGFPADIDELSKSRITFPYLEVNDASSCPVSMDEVLEYLEMETGEDSIAPADLLFVRTAQVESSKYWLWRFTDEDGEECFVTASVDHRGSTCVGYEVNWSELTPEQFMLGDHRGIL